MVKETCGFRRSFTIQRKLIFLQVRPLLFSPHKYDNFFNGNRESDATIQCVRSARTHVFHWSERVSFMIRVSEGVITYSTQLSPSWETDRSSASQDIPRILWHPKVHYRIHNSPPLVPILRQIDLVHEPPSHFLKTSLPHLYPPPYVLHALFISVFLFWSPE